jgi:hypothetical protein
MKEVIAQEVEHVLEERGMSLQIAILWFVMQVSAQNSIAKEEPALPSLFLAHKGIFTRVEGSGVC